jgi:uncharacterized repeat protein (TIGR01451 family)
VSATLPVKLAVLASVAAVVALFVVPIASAHTPSIDASISCDGLVSYTVTGTNAFGRSLDNPDIGVYVNGVKVFDGAFTDLNGRKFTGTYQLADFSATAFTVSTKALGSWGDGTPGGETDSTTVTHGANCDSLSTNATDAMSGGSIQDVATLSHAAAASGTVTFKVFSTSDCSGTALATFSNVAASPSGGNDDGTWTFTSGSYSPTSAGTFMWTASYGGDAHNSPLTEGCGGIDETSTVSKASPTISTNASSPTQTITGNGLELTDTATLAGGASPTGTITFKLFSDATGGCGAQVGSSVTATVTGNGSYPSPSVHVSSAGLYHWVAGYGGDGNNIAVSGACGDANEDVTVLKAAPTISTNAAPLSQTLGSGGLDLSDKATLAAGASPTGTISFSLFADSSGPCGAQVGTAVTVPVNGNGTYTSPTVHLGAAGTYHWIASYGGDASNSPVSGACGDPNENVTVTTPPPGGTPAISITKSPTSQTIKSGGTASFTIAVTNTGTLVLGNVTVSDPLSPSCNETSAIPTLAIGASVTYSCSLSNVTTGFTNVATATGTGSNGQTVTSTDSAAVNVTPPPPPPPPPPPAPHASIGIVKDPKSQTIGQGATATFTITVTNTGDVALGDVTVTDPLSPNCERSLGTLAVGESKHYTCTRTNVKAGFENIATATGTPPTTATVKATDQARIAVKPFIPPQHPKLAIVKSPKSQTLTTTLKTVKSGGGSKTTVTYGTAHFTIKVTNIGDVTLHSISVTDPASPGCNKTIGTLVSHASKTYSCSRSTVTAGFENVATAHGTSPKGVKVEAADHAGVTVRVKRTGTS